MKQQSSKYNNRRDPVRSRLQKLYNGVNQGFVPRITTVIEREEHQEVSSDLLSLWTEDDFKDAKKSIHEEYYCFECKEFMRYVWIKDIYACYNSRCTEYLNFVNMKQQIKPKLLTIDMKEISYESDDEPWITRITQEDLNRDYVLYSRKTIEYESGDQRVKHIWWKGYPKSLSLGDNS